MNKQELRDKARELGFANLRSENEPAWYTDVNENLNLIMFLLANS